VKFYRATQHKPALDLALALKDHTLNYFPADGSYDRRRHWRHVHSTTCTLSSLAQLAGLTRDATLMTRVKAFYDNGLGQLRDAIGWSPENSDPDCKFPERGEVNNSGDILETALILGAWGHVEYYHDAERILRGHILPSQLRDISWITNPPNPEGRDGLRDVAERTRGAWAFPAPHGHAFVGMQSIGFPMDVVGGTVGSLCEACRAATQFNERGHFVKLLLDHETDAIRVESPYTHPALTITLKKPGALHVRVPPWMVMDAVDGYSRIETPPVNAPVTIKFPLPTHELVLKHPTRTIRCRLRGDEVVAMDDCGMPLAFFAPLE